MQTIGFESGADGLSSGLFKITVDQK